MLEPVSTVDATNFYWTASDNVKGDGDAKADSYTKYNETKDLDNTTAGKNKYDEAFNSNYGFRGTSESVAYGYLDYTFFLKATSTVDASKVVMTKCELLYDTDKAVTDKAWRVAMFAGEVVESSTTISLKTIIGLDGADYFTTTTEGSKKQAVNGSNTFADVSNLNASAEVATNLNANSTKYYKVVVRLWIEGEDKSCKNDTYVTLNNSYSLNLEF